MKHGQQFRGRIEDPKYASGQEGAANRQSKAGTGTNAHGDVMTNQVYRQPWVEHDAVADPDGDMKTG